MSYSRHVVISGAGKLKVQRQGGLLWLGVCTKFHEQSRTCSLCSSLRFPVTSSPLRPNILFGSLFTNTLHMLWIVVF
jgi:hypothetical protein